MALTQVLHVLVNERREKIEIEGKTTENKKTLSIFSNNCLLKNTTKVNRLLEIMSLVKLLKQD